MTSEQRLDRLERIAMLMARAGLRVTREQNEKINIIIDAQIKNEDRFGQNEERFRKNEERFERLAEAQAETQKVVKQLAASHKELAASQKHTDERLGILIDIVRTDRNANSN